ncbi:MAG: hypothetical protein R2834_17005 [Rhodothermales bacterium]
MRRIALLVVILVSLAAMPASIHAQSYAQQVWDQLQRHYSVVSDLGDYQLRNYVMGTIREGETDTWTFTFSSDDEYVVTAACDNDCSDIDVKVLTESGKVIKEDTSDDDQPIVKFEPSSTDAYQIEVKMYKCSDNPCYFGFGIFRK